MHHVVFASAGDMINGQEEKYMTDRQLTEKIAETVKEAGKIILSASGTDYGTDSKQGHANYVTKYDRQVQEFLHERLSSLLPEASFLGEEEGEDVFREKYRKGWLFIVDPIDGTTNFIKGYYASTVSVGLFKDGKPYIGVIYQPYLDHIFTACRGSGAFDNGKKIMSSSLPLCDSIIAFGTSPYRTDLWQKTMKLAGEYLMKGQDLRRSGSAAWDCCMVACGAAGLYFEFSLGLWDYAAGAVIIREAGGVITDIYGDELKFDGPSSVLAYGRGIDPADLVYPERSNA